MIYYSVANFIEALQNEGKISQIEQQVWLEEQRQSLLERAQNVIASVGHEQPRNTRSADNQQIEDDLESQGIYDEIVIHETHPIPVPTGSGVKTGNVSIETLLVKNGGEDLRHLVTQVMHTPLYHTPDGEETPGEKMCLYTLSDIDFLQANGSSVRPQEVTRARTIIRACETENTPEKPAHAARVIPTETSRQETGKSWYENESKKLTARAEKLMEMIGREYPVTITSENSEPSQLIQRRTYAMACNTRTYRKNELTYYMLTDRIAWDETEKTYKIDGIDIVECDVFEDEEGNRDIYPSIIIYALKQNGAISEKKLGGLPADDPDITAMRKILSTFEIFSDKYPDPFAEKFIESA